MMTEFDFIIVGGGAAGCALVARLTKGLPDQQVLLLEAGGQNQNPDQKSFGERHWTRTIPGYNWGYKSVTQENFNGREIDYSRGKGLGGSTAINFCVYTRGPSADYDHWAELVGDNSWSWENSLKRFNKIETFRRPAHNSESFVSVPTAAHGKDGPIQVGVPEAWDPGFGEFMSNAYHYHPKNLDHNSGNPIGVSVCQVSTHNGKRVTASEAYLTSDPPNLTIVTETTITKVLIRRKKAVGVEAYGKQCSPIHTVFKAAREKANPSTGYARQEVVLAAGAIDSPKLLLLSGIGPAKDLQEFSIPLVQDLPGVGKNLQDRLFVELVTVQDPRGHHRTSYIDSPAALEQARKQWLTSQSGPLSNYYLPRMISFVRSDSIFSSQEFNDLDSKTRHFMRAETRPCYEILSQRPSISVKAPEKYLSTAVAFPGNHGTGELKLLSSNPSDHPLIDPKFLTRPFDKRLAIESVRETLEFLGKPLMAKSTVRLAGPTGNTDEDVLAYVRQTAISMWHVCGTVKMGKIDEEGACVDKDFKVSGMQNLRVVDMSVAPFLPSAHLQAVAYLVGENAAEKIIAEHR